MTSKSLCFAFVKTVLVLLVCYSSKTVVFATSCNKPSDDQLNRVCNVTKKCEAGGKSDKPILYILAMAPYNRSDNPPSPSWPGGPAVIPGALLAVEHINCDPRILPDHQLKIIISDGGCHLRNRAFVNFTANVYLKQSMDGNIVGIVGGACSESAFTVAEIVNIDDLSLVQIAPTATSPSFITNDTANKNYRNTVRLIVNALKFITVFKNIIVKKNYTEIAMLYDSQRSYMVTVSNEFQLRLQDAKVGIASRVPLFDSYLEQPLEQLRGRNRLIFVFAGSGLARKVLCLAYRMNMLYPNYQLIFINRRAGEFRRQVIVKDPDTDKILANCSKAEMEAALPTATIFEPQAIRPDQNTTISGYTYDEIDCQYKEVLQHHLRSLCHDDDIITTAYQNAYYDSVWALALSLNNSQQQINLTEYKFGKPNETQIILKQFFGLSFEGAIGKVEFDKNTHDTESVARVNIFQQINSGGKDTEIVAFFSQKTGLVNISAHFINSSVFIKREEIMRPPLWLGWTMMALTILVLIFVTVLHYLNGTVGDLKHVKATSPQLNHLIFSGCYLILIGIVAYSCTSVFIIDIKSSDTSMIMSGVFCNIQVWVWLYASSLIFGTICMKTWRIWRIFTHFSSNPIRFAGDSVLIGFVVVLVLLDSVFLLAWIIIDPLYVHYDGSMQQVAVCRSENTVPWVVTTVLYKGLLLVIVLFLSIKTRKVNKREFKQTKSINTFLYIIVINLTLGIAPYSIVTSSSVLEIGTIIAVYVLYCGSSICGTIICVIFIFLPPIYPLLRRKWIRFNTFTHQLTHR